MIGKTISHYRITEKLGGGGMGVVYKAEDIKLHRTVALKFLPPELTRNEDAKKRFFQEAQAASSLQHNNVCTIHDIDETEDGQIFICMACYEGETLRQKIVNGKLRIEEIIDYSKQIAEGLQKAHENGIIHRDIKPENIFITKDGVIKILDFGLAKLSASTMVTKINETVGTASYMSPEQASGTQVDHRTDIWALGVILFEILTGGLPFKSDYEQAMIYSILHEHPSQNLYSQKNVPGYLINLCYSMLSKNPENRPHDMKEVIKSLTMFEPTLRKNLNVISLRSFRKHKNKILASLAFISLLIIGIWYTSKTPVTVDSISKTAIAVDPTKNSQINLCVIPLLNNDEQDNSIKDWPKRIQSIVANYLVALGIYDPYSLNGLLESTFGSSNPTRTPNLYKLISGTSNYLVDGQISKENVGYRIELRLMNPADRKSLHSFNSNVKEQKDLIATVSSLSKDIYNFFILYVLQSTEKKIIEPWIQHGTENLEAHGEFMKAYKMIYDMQPGSEIHLRKAIALDSTFISPRIWLIPTLSDKNDLKEIRKQLNALKKLEATADPFDRAMIEWAGAFVKHDLEKQVQSLSKALTYSENNNILLINLADDRYYLNDLSGALDAINKILKSKWNYPPLYPLYAKCFIRQNNLSEAKRVLKESLDLKVVDSEVYLLLSSLASIENNSTESSKFENEYDRKIRESGASTASSVSVLSEHGEMFLSIKKYDRAEWLYRKANSLVPKNSDVQFGLINILIVRNKLSEAELEISKVLPANHKNSRFYKLMSEFYRKSGKKLKAVESLNTALLFSRSDEESKYLRQKIDSLKKLPD
ncbi:MAG: protein kinase [Ignavibacteriales bacterium]|nr:protein kinase [Ignavibacteriales bacterium]